MAGTSFRERPEKSERPLSNQDSVLGVPVTSGDRPTPPPFVDGLHHAFQALGGSVLRLTSFSPFKIL